MNRTSLTPMLALVLLIGTVAHAGAAPPASPNGAPAYVPAPMPNQDLYAPVERASEDPQLKPTVFRPDAQFRGDGFSPGSTSQSYEERHLMPGFGANFSVPLK